METNEKFSLTKEAATEIILNPTLGKVLLISNNHDKSSYFYRTFLNLNYKTSKNYLNQANSLYVNNIPNYVTDNNYGLILFKSFQAILVNNIFIKASELAKLLNISTRISRRILVNFVKIGTLTSQKVIINNKRYTSYKLNFNYKSDVKIDIDIDTLKALNSSFNIDKPSQTKQVDTHEKSIIKEIIKPIIQVEEHDSITHTISNGKRTYNAYFNTNFNKYVTEDGQYISSSDINHHNLILSKL